LIADENTGIVPSGIKVAPFNGFNRVVDKEDIFQLTERSDLPWDAGQLVGRKIDLRHGANIIGGS
jgi:hypothetical protein